MGMLEKTPGVDEVLGDPISHHISTDIGESEVAALEAVGEFEMIEAELME